MNTRQFSQVLGHVAEELVSSDIDLWPAIRRRIGSGKTNSIQGDMTMQTAAIQTRNRRRSWRVAVVVGSVFLILAALFAATPQGRAWAQDVLQFFTRADSDNLPVQSFLPTSLPTSGTPTPDPFAVRQAIEEVEELAGYKVLKPAWVPDTLSIEGASYQEDHRIVRIFYGFGYIGNGLALTEEPLDKAQECLYCEPVGNSASVQPVQIGSASGEYVVGVWKYTEEGAEWESDPWLQRIRWQDNGMVFELLYMGPPDSVTKDDLVAIAQSIQ